MFRILLVPILALLVVATPRADADPVILVAKGASIASTKANGMPWDFPLVGKKALPDPYVKAWVFDTDGAHTDYGETAVIWDTLYPAWNTELVKARAGQKIKIEVWDKDLKYDDLMGRETFTLTEKMIESKSFIHKFGQVKYMTFETIATEKAKSEPRIVLQQPFPGPNSAKKLTRSTGQTRAVVLLHGLDLRDDGGDPAQPRFVDWQGSMSTLVQKVSKHADVFAISYPQNTAIEEIAAFPELREAVAKVKKLGYDEVVLVAHSAGGILARHLVEEHPRIGVTRVIQLATPNGGATVASWAVNLMQVPKAQATFVESLTPAHRAAVAKARQNRRIPEGIDFVAVVATCTKSKGDGTINRECQYPADLQSQGIPAICLQESHMGVMYGDDSLDVLCKLITQPQPRWSAGKAAQFASVTR